SFVFRYFSEENDDRLRMVNFGKSLLLKPAPEPLLAPPLGYSWEMLWTSDSSCYGGAGSAPVATQEQWVLPAESAVALRQVHENANGRLGYSSAMGSFSSAGCDSIN